MRSAFRKIRSYSAHRWYALLAGLGTVAAAAWLAAIPSDPKNAWLWGLSQSRWALLLPLAGLSAMFLAGFLINPGGMPRLRKIFARSVEQLEGGVYLNVGTAVTGPEVYLKALSMARNVARRRGVLNLPVY